MKRFLFALSLLVAAAAHAGSSSKAPEQQTTAQINFAEFPRSLVFSADRNANSSSGQLLVCVYPHKAHWGDGSCKDQQGNNAWTLAENALPGWRLAAYEWRWSSSTRHLILYFQK